MGLVRLVRRLLLRVFRKLPTPVRVGIVAVAGPRFAVGAVVVLRSGDKVLLLRQRHHVGWTLPGGLLKLGEHPSEAVVREVREELGVDVEVAGVPDAVIVEGRRMDMVFTARWPLGDTLPEPHDDEVLHARWGTLDALPPMGRPTALAIDAVRGIEPAGG